MAAVRTGRPDPRWNHIPKGAKVVVDSAPLIYFLEGHREFAPRFAGVFEAEAAQELQIAISTITLAEVLTGPFKKGEDALAGRYERALSNFEVIPVSAEIAVRASRLRGRYSLKLPDALQLATALEISAHALITHDRDFAKVQGIEILTGPA